jgi:hypothetical protein
MQSTVAEEPSPAPPLRPDFPSSYLTTLLLIGIDGEAVELSFANLLSTVCVLHVIELKVIGTSFRFQWGGEGWG